MSMFDQFETDKSLEQEGVWLDYGDFRIRVAHSGGSNKKYAKLLEEKTKPFRRAIKVGSFPEERSRAILYEVFAKSIILDWNVLDEQGDWVKGIHRKGGGVLEFTEENVIESLKLLPALFNDIQDSASSIALFKAEELEEDSKN